MKKYTLLLLACILLLLSSPPTTCQSAIIASDSSTITGKLVAMVKLKERYQLTVGPKTLFILADGSRQSQELVKTARSFVNKRVTVVYISTSHQVVTIFPAKEKDCKR
jgi:hypothetical protein